MRCLTSKGRSSNDRGALFTLAMMAMRLKEKLAAYLKKIIMISLAEMIRAGLRWGPNLQTLSIVEGAQQDTHLET